MSHGFRHIRAGKCSTGGPLPAQLHAILNLSLIVPPTLGRNTLCSSQSPHQMYPLVEG